MKTLKCLLLIFLVTGQVNAQVIAGPNSIALQRSFAICINVDTIALARSFAYQKDFDIADHLLVQYTTDHNDVNALSLHAQVLYWMKAFDRSANLYDSAIQLFPETSSLYLDYGRMSFSVNKFTRARRLLDAYKRYDSTNVEADVMYAYMYLWNGQMKLAEKKANSLLKRYAGNAEAKDIISKVNQYTVPYIKTGITLLSDDQPLKGNAYHTEAGVYKSWLFSPTAQASFYRFKTADSSFHSRWMQLANSTQLNMKTKIKLQGGVFQQNTNRSAFTGSLEISRKIASHFLLLAAIEKRPYQFAAGSVKTMVMENVSTVSLSYNRNNKWMGEAAYNILEYEDANKIGIAHAWLLMPVVSLSGFSLSAGYAFRYADAVKNTFSSKKSVDELLSAQVYKDLPGVYSPYFTPERQLVHAALASVNIIPLKKLYFSSRISIGFSAKGENPYLWLQKSGNEYFISRGYAPVDFAPVSWTNELRLLASDRLSFAASYSYDKLLYYKSHKGSLELKYLFLK